MPQNPLRNLLNRLLWDPHTSSNEYIIAFRSRGAPGDVEEINAENLVKVTRDYIYIRSGNELKAIPLHRIAYIRHVRSGKDIYPFKHTS